MLSLFLDGERYISGIWRLLDSDGRIHSLVSGRGTLGWFYGYAAFAPHTLDFSYTINYIEGAITEQQCDSVITATIEKIFGENTPLKLANPPQLVRQHYFEVRSSDPKRIRAMLDLATTLSFDTPI